MRYATSCVKSVFLVAIVVFWARGALAAGISAGASIGNTATLNFKVSGVSQPPVLNPPATFVVDRKINVTVAVVGASTSVSPGATDQVIKYTVTNNSNDTLDFRLVATNDTSPADNFDPTNIRVFEDVNGNGVYDPATDTRTFLDQVLPDTNRTVFVVSNIPITPTNGQTAGITLTVFAATSTAAPDGILGADVAQTVGADTPDVDTVFADPAGPVGNTPADVARDGKHSADGVYTVQATGISVIKTATVISDPVNGTTNPKAIPGAVIEYCIQIVNAVFGATVTAVTLSDPIPASTTFVPGSIFVGGTVTGGVCNTIGAGGGTAVTDASGFSAGPPQTVTTPIASVAAGTTITSRFRVTVVLSAAITNTATVNFNVGGVPQPPKTGTVTTLASPAPTKSIAMFYAFVKDSTPPPCLFAADGTLSSSSPKPCALQSDGTLFSDSSGTFSLILPPKKLDGDRIRLSDPVSVTPTNMYLPGEPIFITLSDGNRNASSTVRDVIEIEIVSPTGDHEKLRLQETGVDTGIFAGVIQSVPLSDPIVANNGVLSIAPNTTITVSYIDPDYPTDTAKAEALVDPFGRVFNAVTGALMNGASVHLVIADTGADADVKADDGTTFYPATVISGGTVNTTEPGKPSDTKNKAYIVSDGVFRFPNVAPGDYRLVVTPPTGFSAPSAVPLAQLQSNAATKGFATGQGSKGDRFTVIAGKPIQIDIPIDPPGLIVDKSVNRTEAAIGDFLSYQIAVTNKSQAQSSAVVLTDLLPIGFRYRAGSARQNNVLISDPAVGADGRALTFQIGAIPPDSKVEIRYVAEVTAGTPIGNAVNQASAKAVTASGDPVVSNVAQVAVKVFLFGAHGTIIGRVVEGACNTPWDDLVGVPYVRIMMEDGTYVVTDADGQYHFEKVEKGTHVVQLDPNSLGSGWELISCIQNTRFSGRADSQFVEMEDGMLWRADFYLHKNKPTPPIELTAPILPYVPIPQPAPIPPKIEEGAVGISVHGQIEVEQKRAPSSSLSLASHFDINKAILKKPDIAALNRLVATLKNTKIERVDVIGHTDNKPTHLSRRSKFANNYVLSKARAGVVAQYLAKGLGIPLNRFLVSGRGPDAPIAKNKTAYGRAQNRRTEVQLFTAASAYSASVSKLSYQVDIDGSKVPVSNFRVMVNLPAGLQVIHETAHLDGVLVTPLSSDGDSVIFPLNDIGADFTRRIDFGVEVIAKTPPLPNQGCVDGRLTMKATALFNTESEPNLKTLTVINLLPCVPAPSATDRDLDETRKLTHANESSERKEIGIKRIIPGEGIPASKTDKIELTPTVITPIVFLNDATAAGENTDWLAGQEPGIAWLFPPPHYNPRAPMVRVVIKHLPGQKVLLSAGSQPVYSKKSDETQGSVSVSSFHEIPIREGDNTFNAIILGEDERTVISRLHQTIHFSGKLESAKFLPESSHLLADGVGRPTLATQLLDKAGQPVRAGTAGFYTIISQPKTAASQTGTVSSQGIAPPQKWRVLGDDGVAYLELNPTTDPGEVLIRFLPEGAVTTATVGTSTVTVLPTVAIIKPAVVTPPLDDVTAAGGNTEWLLGQANGVTPDWLFPPQDHNPRAPVVRIVILHLPNQQVMLTRGRIPFNSASGIPPLSFDGTQVNADKTVAVSIWHGIPLLYGDNLFNAHIMDTESGGQVSILSRVVHYANRPAHVTFLPDQSNLIADGIKNPVLAVRVTDKNGRPVRSGVTGSFTMEPPFLPQQVVDEMQHRQLAGMDGFKPMWQVTGDEGVALIQLKPTTETGEVIAVFLFEGENVLFGRETRKEEVRGFMESAPRDFVVVGFAEGTVGYNTLKGNMEALNAEGVKDNLFTEGEVKFYAKGRIRGDWLLTLAADSTKKESGRESLFQTIDPNTFYTLYGDGTGQGYDASSQRKLYLKLERHQFYALFGDFETGLTKTELMRYSRALNGVKVVSKGHTILFEAFAAQTPQHFVRDEIQGAGTSGLYRLSRGGIVLNGEHVRIETRDRLRSERVIETRSLTRHLDYDIDYPNGTLFFRQPIPARDTNFNPVFIIVEYEVSRGADNAFNAGGRVGVKLPDWSGVTGEVGLSYIRNADQLTKTNLGGMDMKIKSADGTEVRLEGAGSAIRTDGVGGGIASGSAYLAEVTHHDKGWDAVLYTRLQDADFGVNQQNGSQTGIKKTGAIGKMALTPNIAIVGEGSHEANLSLLSTRDVFSARLEASDQTGRAFIGLQSAHDQSSAGASFDSRQAVVGAGRQFLNNRLELSGTADISLGGKNSSVDYPSRYVAQAGLRLTEATRLIVAEEVSNGNASKTHTTRVGLQSNPWKGAQLTTTLNQDHISEYGPRTFGVMGLSQSLLLGKEWGVDFAIDQSRTFGESKTGAPTLNPNYPPAVGGTLGNWTLTEDYVALSAGATYRHALWSWNGRIENRNGEIDKRLGITTGFLHEAKAGVAFSSSLRLFETKRVTGTEGLFSNVDVSLAYRPLGTNWSVLDKLQFRYETLKNGTGVAGSGLFGNNSLTTVSTAKSRALIHHFNLNVVSRAWEGKDREGNLFYLNQRSQGSVYYGSKYSFDQYDGVDYNGYTDLLGVDMRHDVLRWIDIGLHGEMLHSWHAHNYKYAVGPMIGISPIENGWITLGYNFLGFYDRDFEEARYTASGPYIKFRIKFDQNTLKEKNRE